MNWFRYIVCGLVFAAALKAEDVRIRLDVISVAKHKALELEADSWEQVRNWISEGHAKVEKFSLMRIKLEEKSAHIGREAFMSSELTIPCWGLSGSSSRKQNSYTPKLNFAVIPWFPQTFQILNVGERIEYRPSYNEATNRILINLNWEFDKLRPMRSLYSYEDQWGRITVPLPELSKQNFGTTVEVEPGEHSLVTIFSNHPKRLHLVFLSARYLSSTTISGK